MEWHINLRRHLGPRRFDRCRQITEAAIQSFAEHGFAESSIAKITAIAKLQRTQFYFFYENKIDCFTACHRLCLADLEARIRDATAETSTWQESVRAGIAAAVGAVRENPYAVQLVLLEAEFVGTEADRRIRDEAYGRLAHALEAVFEPAAGPDVEVTPLMVDTAIGSIKAVLSQALKGDRHEELAKLALDLTIATMAVCIGPSEARKLAEAQAEGLMLDG